MSLIDSISGILFGKNPTEAVIDIGGIRFRVNISIATYESLPDLSEQVEILTYLHVKDDILDLYGFRDLSERSLFMNLNMVSGIGPRSAMNILSGTNPEEFKKQIVAGDVKSLTVIPGIGAKTAKRIIVELKEKFEADTSKNDDLGFIDDNIDSDLINNVSSALQSLGYKQAQINNTIKELDKLGEFSGTIEEVIRKALSKMI
ncbi:MAG: Holliday junction branch migration protein RuvA [Candidatus Marinimicrobia bacterium]|nr:Holliday junction branch migration protein RuvA [Candidatus Neomarinimicrobiota bacterium]|tara:strand:+ start:198 stop:806 length:609 start_codon:yes stop_codon:yes gene_type:complete